MVKMKFLILKQLKQKERMIKEDFILTDIYMDEGPKLSVDIDIEPPMVRVILDFLMK